MGDLVCRLVCQLSQTEQNEANSVESHTLGSRGLTIF